MRGLDSFSTPRLLAERVRAADLDDIYRMNRTAAVMAAIGGVRSLEATSEYLEKSIEHWDQYGFGLGITGRAQRGALAHCACNPSQSPQTRATGVAAMTLMQVIVDVLISSAVLGAVLFAAYRVVAWARKRRKRAYVVGALFAPFMALGHVRDPDFRIVNEAKQHKKREEDEPGDPPRLEDDEAGAPPEARDR